MAFKPLGESGGPAALKILRAAGRAPRPCLKNVKTPKRRIFFRHFALIFLAIHRVWRRQTALIGEKISRPCAIIVYQTRPNPMINLLYNSTSYI